MTNTSASNFDPSSTGSKIESIEHGQGVGLIDRLIEKQQNLTAVEMFSQRHEAMTGPALESHYRDLIPLDALESDEQYSFEVDLDACSGCKACVVACHNLNGLEEDEVWRNVGMLTGGSKELPVIQHVTSACHHCVEPACMHGCPVNAYEKDPVTGIVEHLDDQCIGCKYCMLTCPYDVPSYSESKGIVRKCNMCTDRLAVGEAPACVQACPNQAIKIRKVSKSEVVKEFNNSNVDGSGPTLVAGAPDSRISYPTTKFITNRPQEASWPATATVANVQHAHYPLVFMLLLTQMAFGLFAAACCFKAVWPAASDAAMLGLNLFAFATLNVGLGVALLHLGRPLKAYRAMANLKTSWLSREIAGFNLFAGAAAHLVAWSWFDFPEEMTGVSAQAISIATVVGGAIAVACSAMLYVVTKRPLWSAGRTFGLFFLAAATLGTAFISAAILLIGSMGYFETGFDYAAAAARFASLTMVFVVVKFILEAGLLRYRNDLSGKGSPLGLSMQLLLGQCRPQAIARIALGILGGLVLPAIVVFAAPSVSMVVAIAAALILFAAEAMERYLFFAVCVARQMPGAPTS